MSQPSANATRRQLLKAGAMGAVASMGAGAVPGAAHASPPDDLITRTIPKTGQRVPAIGLGSFTTFDTLPGQSRDHIHEVVRRFWQAGGRVFDTSALYGASEANLGEAVAAQGIQNQMFLTNKVWSTGEYLWDDSHAAANLERSLQRLSRGVPVDVMQCHSLVNVDVVVPLLHAWKKEGRIRLAGVTHHDPAYFDNLAGWIERGDLDFVQVRYSMATRHAEKRILRAAADRGIAVLVNMPLEKARLHHLMGTRQLPALARELNISTWAEFFLKWVISHPAVTCAIPATSQPRHVLQNVAAMRGPLPDERMRAHMLRYMRSVPGFEEVDRIPWYPGKRYQGLVIEAQRALLGRSSWRP